MNELIWETNSSPSVTRPYSLQAGSGPELDSASGRRFSSSTSVGRSVASGRNPFWSRSSAGGPPAVRRPGSPSNTSNR